MSGINESKGASLSRKYSTGNGFSSVKYVTKTILIFVLKGSYCFEEKIVR